MCIQDPSATIGETHVRAVAGVNLNQELVTQGWCWWYRKYAPGDTVLEGLEKEAREGRKELWADPKPVPPWEWRKLKWLFGTGRKEYLDGLVFK